MKPSYRKLWAGNLLMWSDLTLSPSFNIKRGQPNLKVLISRLLLILEVCNVKPTHRKSWAGNLLMLDLTFGPCFKVKQWFTGFGELSYWWIQICIGCPMRKASSRLSLSYLLLISEVCYMKPTSEGIINQYFNIDQSIFLNFNIDTKSVKINIVSNIVLVCFSLSITVKR